MAKNYVVTAIGAAAGALVAAAGGWDSALKALIVFMVLDYLTGVIVAGVFHKSKKTDSGKLSSAAGLKGLAKKVLMLFLVDGVIGSHQVVDGFQRIADGNTAGFLRCDHLQRFRFFTRLFEKACVYGHICPPRYQKIKASSESIRSSNSF